MSAPPYQAALVDASNRVTPGPWRNFFDALAGAQPSGQASATMPFATGGGEGDPVGDAIAEIASFFPAPIVAAAPVAAPLAIPFFPSLEGSDPSGDSLAEMMSFLLPPPAPVPPPAASPMPFLEGLGDEDPRNEALAEIASFLPPAGSHYAAFDGLTALRLPFIGTGGAFLDDDPGLVWDDTNKRLVLATLGQTLDAPDSSLKPQIHIGGDFDGAAGTGVFYIDGYGAQPNISMRRRDGSQASPSALAASAIIFNFRSVGYDGSADALGGVIRMIANGAWSGTNHGQDFLVSLTANGATGAPVERFRISTGAVVKATVAGAFGHQAGAGGSVTQATSKATGVTLNKATGAITLNNAALAADTTVSFTLTNDQIEANDLILVTHKSAGTGGAYTFAAFPAAGSATIHVRNVTTGSLSEAIVISFSVIKGVLT